MSLKTELKAIQDKKNVVDHAMFEHIVNTVIADLKYNAETSKMTFVHYGVHNFVFDVPLHKENYSPGETCSIYVSVDNIADLKNYFENEGITIDGAWTRTNGNGCITLSWE